MIFSGYGYLLLNQFTDVERDSLWRSETIWQVRLTCLVGIRPNFDGKRLTSYSTHELKGNLIPMLLIYFPINC